MTATCPNGITVAISPRSRQARFKRHCEGCPLRQRCTRSRHDKILSIHLVGKRIHIELDVELVRSN